MLGVSDPEKYPNDRALENVEDGFDDDLDVPTYRKLAEPNNDDTTETQQFPGVPAQEAPVTETPDKPEQPEAPAVAATEEKPVTEQQPKPRYDAYAAAGRTAPQVIAPGGRPSAEPEPVAEPEPEQQPTEAFIAPDERELNESDADNNEELAQTEFMERPEAYPADDFSDEYRDADYNTGQTAVAAGAVGVGVAGATNSTNQDPAYYEDTDYLDDEEEETRRGTIDFGLLILRLGLGALLVIQGLTTFLGWGGSGGTGAIAADFEANNFALASVMATAIPTVQLLAGALLILGLATPLGAALALALSAYLSMYEVATASAGATFVGSEASGIQLQLLVTVIALAIQFTGPGRIGIDFSRGWARRPLASSWIFCILAVAAAVGLWWLTTNTLPFVG